MRSMPIDAHGMVHEAQTREQARGDLIDRWDRDRQAAPERSRIILTHTNDEVRALNEAARERMRAAGDLGDDVRLTVERGDAQLRQRGSRHVPAKRTRAWREERHARDHRTGQRAIHDRAAPTMADPFASTSRTTTGSTTAMPRPSTRLRA